jgi:tetratricopeptide (TPR) repeat protein
LFTVFSFTNGIVHYLKALQIYPTSDTHYKLPNHVGANINLGAVLYQQGKLDKAVETYRKGLHFVPNSVDMHHNPSFLLEKQGLRDEAIKELQTALQKDPNSVEIGRVLETILTKRS